MVTPDHSAATSLRILFNLCMFTLRLAQRSCILLPSIVSRRVFPTRKPATKSEGMEMTVLSELRMRPATAERWGWDASTTARLVLAGVVIFTLLVGANLATPLYPLLQARIGLSSLDVTVAFSSYVLALVAVLMVAGHWSDHIGRRAALVLAVMVGLVG